MLSKPASGLVLTRHAPFHLAPSPSFLEPAYPGLPYQSTWYEASVSIPSGHLCHQQQGSKQRVLAPCTGAYTYPNSPPLGIQDSLYAFWVLIWDLSHELAHRNRCVYSCKKGSLCKLVTNTAAL